MYLSKNSKKMSSFISKVNSNGIGVVVQFEKWKNLIMQGDDSISVMSFKTFIKNFFDV